MKKKTEQYILKKWYVFVIPNQKKKTKRMKKMSICHNSIHWNKFNLKSASIMYSIAELNGMFVPKWKVYYICVYVFHSIFFSSFFLLNEINFSRTSVLLQCIYILRSYIYGNNLISCYQQYKRLISSFSTIYSISKMLIKQWKCDACFYYVRVYFFIWFISIFHSFIRSFFLFFLFILL